MKYGAYYHRRRNEIVWFRTQRALETGFYHRHSHHGERPDVYLTDDVQDLIINSYPWVKEVEDNSQHEIISSDPADDLKSRRPVSTTDYLRQRLDPNDPTVWLDEPHWGKHLKRD